MKFKFKFNAKARREACSSLKKMGNWGSSFVAAAANLLFKDEPMLVVVLCALAAINFLVCSAAVVFISGLEEVKSDKSKGEDSG